VYVCVCGGGGGGGHLVVFGFFKRGLFFTKKKLNITFYKKHAHPIFLFTKLKFFL